MPRFAFSPRAWETRGWLGWGAPYASMSADAQAGRLQRIEGAGAPSGRGGKPKAETELRRTEPKGSGAECVEVRDTTVLRVSSKRPPHFCGAGAFCMHSARWHESDRRASSKRARRLLALLRATEAPVPLSCEQGNLSEPGSSRETIQWLLRHPMLTQREISQSSSAKEQTHHCPSRFLLLTPSLL